MYISFKCFFYALICHTEEARPPELLSEHSVQEGQPAVFKCSVRHTCPSHQPRLTWSHSGKEMLTYKDIGHGNWEVESILTFTPTKDDDHSDIICTVKYHGNRVKGTFEARRPVFVKGIRLNTSRRIPKDVHSVFRR